jgi:hypothetical protein
MCTWLFIVIMVHCIHHWNYLRFNVYFVVTSMLIYPWMCLHLGPKPHWASMASPLNINGMISFFNKFFSSFFFLLLLRVFYSPWIWMVMKVSIWKNISHLNKEVPWSMCYYYCMWVLHILIESPTYIELIVSMFCMIKKYKNTFILVIFVHPYKLKDFIWIQLGLE